MPERLGLGWAWLASAKRAACVTCAVLLMAATGSTLAGQRASALAPLNHPQPPAGVPSPSSLAEPPALLVPVQGVEAAQLHDTYTDQRAGGARAHEAMDIMAPRGTPVLAADDGHIAKLFLSRPGGITIYQFDPSRRFAYYYAHLDRYAEGLTQGQTVRRGEVLGYVGSTGNANPDAPHLHFGIFRLDAQQRWWTGVPLNPYPYLRGAPAKTSQD